MLVNIETNSTAFELNEKITPLNAVCFVKFYWEQVTKETERNSFYNARFKHGNMSSEEQLTVTSDPLNSLANILKNKNLWELTIDNEFYVLKVQNQNKKMKIQLKYKDFSKIPIWMRFQCIDCSNED